MKLANLPKAFSFPELKKGWFPHKFNQKKYWNYIGPYPAPEYYGVANMSTGDRKSFYEWYDSVKQDVFVFQTQILEYCRSDVMILAQSLKSFRNLLQEVTTDDGQHNGIDCFKYVTIASLCMGVYRSKFLEETWSVNLALEDGKTVENVEAKFKNGVMKVHWQGEWLDENLLEAVHNVKLTGKKFIKSPIALLSSTPKEKFSKPCIEWLSWLEHTQKKLGNDIQIQHAMNLGEMQVQLDSHTKYKLDGYCEADGKRFCFEYQGCEFHGYEKCYPHQRSQSINPRTKQTMEDMYNHTLYRQKRLEEMGFTCISIWHHDFQQQLKTNPELKEFVENLDIEPRLNPRDAFYGGRCETFKLHHKVSQSEKIKYLDICSLYPSVMKMSTFGVGRERVITKDFGPLSQYWGLIKARVMPPRLLHLPVLPYKTNGKLVFTLCKSCADLEQQAPCHCTDKERAITGTWFSEELKLAESKGYKIEQIFSVWHYDELSTYDQETKKGGLFTEYINTFLALKQAASSWPTECVTEEDKRNYIADYFENEGVLLDYDKIEKNEGMRSLAKLLLNSFWGRFGMRSNLKQTNFIHESESERFYNLITDPTKEIQLFHIINEDIIQMEWSHTDEDMDVPNATNVALAAVVTGHARMKLYVQQFNVANRNVLVIILKSLLVVGQRTMLLG
jgi:hypothetical protein